MRVFLFLCLFATSSGAADWPHWRGESRNGRSAESSRFDAGAWPPGEAAWTAGVGIGSSSVVVVGETLYAIGHVGGHELVTALGVTDGAVKWQQRYAAPTYGRHATGDQGFYKGTSATPEFDRDTGRLYTMGIDGDLRCWDTSKGGAAVWGINLYDEFGIQRRPQVTKRPRSHRDYGYPNSPLVLGRWLLVEVGDPKRGNLLCFDKSNGKLLWGSENKDPAGHTGGPVLLEVEGVPCVAVLTATHLVVTRLDEANVGKTVARYPWATDFLNNIPTPVAVGSSLLVTSRYNIDKMAKLDITLREGAKLAWESDSPSGVCTPVVHEAKIYFANKGFYCLDLATGKKLWEGGRYSDPGSVILTADERLIAWANDGDLTLVEAAGRSPNKYTELAAKKRVLSDMAWPHVVLAAGRLFCKDRGGRLVCLPLEAGARAAVVKKDVPEPGGSGDPAGVAPAAFALGAWPGESERLVLGWRRGGGKRSLSGALPKAGRYAWKARGDVAFADDGAMRLGGGAFGLVGDHDALREALVKSGQFSLELVFRTGDLRQAGPTRIVSFSESAYSRNFTLGQERDRLVLRLRTPDTDENGKRPEVDLGAILADQLYHLVVTYRDGDLACYLNGREHSRSDAVRGGFDNWTRQHFWIGDEHDGGREWSGEVYGVALFDLAMGGASASKRFAAITASGRD